MESPQDKCKRAAIEKFRRGYNCAEAVLEAFLETVAPQAPCTAVASPFGGGMARSGGACGALVGGLMAIGLRYGRRFPEDNDGKERATKLGSQFLEQFRRAAGTTLCAELTGCLLNTAEGSKTFHRENTKERVCVPLVSAAATILCELTDREPA